MVAFFFCCGSDANEIDMIIFKDLTGWPSRKSIFHRRKRKIPHPGLIDHDSHGRIEYTNDSTWIFMIAYRKLS